MPLNEQEFNRLQIENERLSQAVKELSVLNEIATAISSSLKVEKIIDLIIHKCIRNFNVEQGAIWLLNLEDMMAPLNTMVRNYDSSHDMIAFRLNNQITGWMLHNKKPLVCNDLKSDNRFHITESELAYNSLLAVPLSLKGKMTGLIALFNKKGETGFSEEDQKLLSIIAAQSAQVIENARLYEEEQRYLTVQQEMKLANEIQRNLLPNNLPELEGYEFAGISIPAKEVGGDYFDFINISESTIACCLGDVSGKGMPAAMLMSNLQATMHSQVLHNPEPQSCISTTNRLLYYNTDTKQYATFFYGLLDWKQHRFKFTNAGHNPPLLFRTDRSMTELKTEGIPLGFLDAFDYTQESVSIGKGDFLIIYTDGISEAMNAEEEEFGEERMMNLLQQAHGDNAGQILENLMNAVKKFTGDTEQSDDITVMVIKRST